MATRPVGPSSFENKIQIANQADDPGTLAGYGGGAA